MNLQPGKIFLCLAISMQQLHAQTPPGYENFTTENGLSNNIVYCVSQDAKGFLWIGTNNGLNRFDGYGFKIFRNDPFDKNSLCANQVHAIEKDSKGHIWIGTTTGLCRYNDSTGYFKTVLRTSGLDQVWQILPINKNELMVSTGSQFGNKNL